MNKTVKFLHTMGAVGLTGTLAVHMLLLTMAPPPESLAEYALIREAIAFIGHWLLVPSLGLVLASGMLAIMVRPQFAEKRWVLLKILIGLPMFEGTLIAINGPAQEAAKVANRIAAGTAEPTALVSLIDSEWKALWFIMALAVANIALAVWRPPLKRRPAPEPTESEAPVPVD